MFRVLKYFAFDAYLFRLNLNLFYFINCYTYISFEFSFASSFSVVAVFLSSSQRNMQCYFKYDLKIQKTRRINANIGNKNMFMYVCALVSPVESVESNAINRMADVRCYSNDYKVAT